MKREDGGRTGLVRKHLANPAWSHGSADDVPRGICGITGPEVSGSASEIWTDRYVNYVNCDDCLRIIAERQIRRLVAALRSAVGYVGELDCGCYTDEDIADAREHTAEWLSLIVAVEEGPIL